MRFLSKVLNLFKIQGRFIFDWIPEIVIKNPEGFSSWGKRESCYICLHLSYCKVWRFAGKGKAAELNFKIGGYLKYRWKIWSRLQPTVSHPKSIYRAPGYTVPPSPTYRGLVPLVPQVIDYGPRFCIRPVPSNGKRLGNQTPRARHLRFTWLC
jgi:hypothetical protein